MKRSDEVKSLVKTMEPTFLPRAKNKGYICPVCGNGSGRDGDGITKKPRSNYYHCFKCGLHDDIFGLIGKEFDIPDFKDQLEKACDLYGISTGEMKMPVAKAPAAPEPEPEEPEIDHSDEYKEWNKALNVPGNPGLAYMQGRGLSLETLNRFECGFASDWKHPKTAHLKKVPTSPRVIVPTSKTSYLARDIRDPEELNDIQRKYIKSKVSRVHLFNEAALTNADDIVFVVEGEIDAMSIYEVGFNAVGLGSASNKSVFVDAVKKAKPEVPIIILPDNDNAGHTSAREIAEMLRDAGYTAHIASIFGDCKDASKLLEKNRTKLELSLHGLALQSKIAPVKERDETNRLLLSYLNLFDRHKNGLMRIGLTEAQIDGFCYRSVPSNPKAVCKALRRKGAVFEGNPVFTKAEDGEWTLAFKGPGLLIPERNSKGQIQGFLEVPDDKDVRITEQFVHFRRGERELSEIIVVGSALEADIISAMMGYSSLSVSKACAWQLDPVFRTLISRGYETVRWACREPEKYIKLLTALELEHRKIDTGTGESLCRWLLKQRINDPQ